MVIIFISQISNICLPVILCEYMCHKGAKKEIWGSKAFLGNSRKRMYHSPSPPEAMEVLPSSSISFLHPLKSTPPYEHFPGSHESSCRTILSAKAWQAVIHLTMENSDGDKSMVLKVMVRLTERTAGTAITLSF